jgi:hypothetical protein
MTGLRDGSRNPTVVSTIHDTKRNKRKGVFTEEEGQTKKGGLEEKLPGGCQIHVVFSADGLVSCERSYV